MQSKGFINFEPDLIVLFYESNRENLRDCIVLLPVA